MASIATLAVQLTLRSAAFSRGLTQNQRNVLNFSQSIATLGRSVQRVGLLINGSLAAGLFLAAKAGAEFEEEMARVDAITQATEDDFISLSRAARAMGEQTVFTATQAAQALREFSQAGFSVKESMASLRPVLDFAVAGNLDIAEAADIAARVLRGMGLDATDMEATLNVLVKAYTKASVSVAELGEAFKFVGPVGRAAGKEMAELTAVLTVFAKAGIRGEQGGTALRNILLRLQAQPTEVKKSLEQLGITVANEQGRLKNLATIFEEVKNATENLTEVDRQAIISRIAGIRATAAFSAAMNAGATEIRAFEKDFAKADDTMKRIADRQLETVRSKFLLMKSAITETLLSINDGLRPALNNMLEGLAEVAKGINSWIKSNQGLVNGLLILTAAVGTILIGFGVLATTFVVGVAAVIAFQVAAVSAAFATGLMIVTFVALAAVVVLATVVVGLLAAEFISVAAGVDAAERRFNKLNQSQEKLSDTSRKLIKINKELQKLEKERATANAADAGFIQQEMQRKLIKATELRLKKIRDIMASQGLSSTIVNRQLDAERKVTNQLVEQRKVLKKLEAAQAALNSQVAKERDARAKVTKDARLASLAEKTGAVITSEKLNILRKTNEFEARRLQILMDQKRLNERIVTLTNKSTLDNLDKALAIRNGQNRIQDLTDQKLALLDKEKAARIQSFIATEKQLALLKVQRQKEDLLLAAKTEKQRGLIEAAAFRKRVKIREDFLKREEKDKKDEKVDIAGQPGAFREGTVEAFKRAFGRKSPILEETKKQTEEQKKANRHLKAIREEIKANGKQPAKASIGT